MTPYEAEFLIQSIQEINIREYSSRQWFQQHESIYKLNLQSHRNAKAREDEFIQDSMVTFDKLKPLIYNLIVSETWKSKVLPLCLPEVLSLSSIRSYTLVSSK